MYIGANPNIKYGLWIIIMYQWKFHYCHKFTTLLDNVNNGAGSACVGSGDIWEISALYCYEPKNALTIKPTFKKVSQE